SYANLRQVITEAAQDFASEVRQHQFPEGD
ncbi:MAG: 3-methyl-2-oxobutanoate hydroxymethyltransferase, partial [Cyanobacteria bacterium SW_4_48_29]